MSEKYIDLADTIIEEEDFDYGFMVKATLSALDKFAANYPDQVPGRTITAGEVGRWSHLINGREIETPSILDFLEALGITVVPDPEPTNAEKLADDIREVDGGHNLGAGILAERLAALDWVKAPGDDDD